MWEAAIEAVKNNDTEWINANHLVFKRFFRKENTLEKGKLGTEALEQHYKEGLFKMFIEASLKGLELDLDIGAKWIESASCLDGNWGWLLAIGVGGGYFTHYLSEDVREAYFKPENALVAGSGKPVGEALKRGGVWEVNGSWDYCSGSEQASLFTAVTKKEGAIKAIVLPKDKVRIERNWNAIGLRLTCSHRITADKVHITEDHFFDLSRSPFHSDYPLSSYPFDLFARACFVPVILGITQTLFVEIEKIADQKSKIWQQYQPEKYRETRHILSRFDNDFERLSDEFYSVLRRSWQNHLKNRDVNTPSVQKISLELGRFCYDMSSKVIPLLGMQVMELDHPVQVCWRDLQTAYQHMVFREY